MKDCKGKPYYVTTAIAYASGKPHIGNTYEIVLADAIARYKREEGYDVRFMTGTDEHGQKIEEKAAAAGVTPKEYVDAVAAEIRRIFDLMNTSYDKFIRTTDPYHEKQVQKMFKRMYDKGDIYKGAYEGWYCTPCESFWTESQLVDGKCPDCGRAVSKAKEEAYFFKMSKYADRLIQYINEHPEFIQPVARKNEMMNNFLLPGLQDLCVSRTSFKWGIPVDFDDKHVVYVWLDALTNYITGLGLDLDGDQGDAGAAYAASETAQPADPDKGRGLVEKYWPADLHLIGKDIIRFHTIYWPIFLMSLDLPLPKQVFGHPWLLQGDGKMSKSKGNVIYADDLADMIGVDAVRYFVLHEMPFDNDGVISWDLITERFNSDLANILGNLVSRTVSMANKYFGGVMTYAGEAEDPTQKAIDDDLKAAVLTAAVNCTKKMEELRVADAITEVWSIFRRSNKYIDETTPWVLAKSEETKPRLQTVLYNLGQAIAIGASLLHSFMPETSEKVLAQLGAEKLSLEDMGVLPEETPDAAAAWKLYKSGTKVTESPEILFARLDPKEMAERVEKLQAAQKAAAAGTGDAADAPSAGKDASAEAGAAADSDEKPMDVEAKKIITYDDFAKLQIQIGVIEACEEVPKSKKLLKSQVRIGSQTRTILSGIKKWYKPEDMVGRKVMVLTNLAPRQIAGYDSEGMILCAEDDEGNVILMSPEKDIKSGSVIG
jgi:methionyl-tRNA synthetase